MSQFLDEGYIKFELDWNESPHNISPFPSELLTTRDEMHSYGLIGYYPEHKVGYGNISLRHNNNQFIISGTQTGHIERLNQEAYSLVTSFDIDKNKVHCKGSVKASSEAMTHATIYKENPETNAIIHIHHLDFWNKWLHKLPTTKEAVPYGTPEMAHEMQRLLQLSETKEEQIIFMAGHEEGIISYGKTLDEAKTVLMNYYLQL